MNARPDPLLILGAGSWGTALALVLARKGVVTRLWDCDRAHVHRLAAERCNQRYLPGIPLPGEIVPVPDLGSALADVRDIVVAIPCEGLRCSMQQLGLLRRGNMRMCIASKGLEPGTLALNHEVIADCLGPVPVAVLSGPSFAAEVAAGQPTAVTLASASAEIVEVFAGYFHDNLFRIYTSSDIIGVQVGGAVKNVIAIAAGIADGLGFGANTRAALITRGLAEITRLGLAVGGRRETFTGLAGLGDLVLTCTDDQSRNRRLGLALARGRTLEETQAAIGQVIEGVRTAQAVRLLAGRHGIEMPITEQVVNVIEGTATPAAAVKALLAREPRSELGA
ncbi:MAG: NAD(P)-dependent glycerol-3-phosphate dehydrogenase [Gammaproteobacteria bacterium]|nr:NAD(P)-dependent glycerol-3-phosphate dehydrogenase [Gammaproteobacteria bacterium]